MEDKNDPDPNPPAEDGTFLPLNKRTMAERSFPAFDNSHEPEFKKQRLEELQRKAYQYHSVLLASESETSETSHKSQTIQKLMEELNIDQETRISVSDKTDNSEKKHAAWSGPNSVPDPESLVVWKRVHARSPNDDEDDSPTNKKTKLHEHAYDHDVLHAFNAEPPALLSHSRTLIMQDVLEECNKAHISIDDNIKAAPPLVEASTTTAKIVEPRSRFLPEDLQFRPTALGMSTYLKQKALGQPIEACIVPEERHDIFSLPPRDLPGYPEETHWYYYCMKRKGHDPRSLWTRFREDTPVFDLEENCVGIKRRFTLTEREEERDDEIFLPDEEEPPVEEWFIKEISLPSSFVDTDWVLCHVVLKKRVKTREDVEEEEYYDEEEEEEMEE